MTLRICFLHVTGGIITTPCNNNLRILSSTTPLVRRSSTSSSSSFRSSQVDILLHRRYSSSIAQSSRSSSIRTGEHSVSFTSTFQGKHNDRIYTQYHRSSSLFHSRPQQAGFLTRTTTTTTMSQKEMLSPAQVHALLSDEGESSSSTVYVDVRTTSEYDGGHIPQAVNMPVATFGLSGMSAVESFADDLAAQIGEKGYTKVIVGCKSGRRSTMAIDKLVTKHPEVAAKITIYELDGGFDNYAGNEDLPVEKK